ncbi:hypothetical protein LZ554_009393 [Drepanopeziza brunnea f. sp. 'monogermtubi']|nr:hypothetical protein LZ554_009393 [Drepanopeziza brunnea f. sp. 'monogermtubi']
MLDARCSTLRITLVLPTHRYTPRPRSDRHQQFLCHWISTWGYRREGNAVESSRVGSFRIFASSHLFQLQTVVILSWGTANPFIDEVPTILLSISTEYRSTCQGAKQDPNLRDHTFGHSATQLCHSTLPLCPFPFPFLGSNPHSNERPSRPPPHASAQQQPTAQARRPRSSTSHNFISKFSSSGELLPPILKHHQRKQKIASLYGTPDNADDTEEKEGKARNEEIENQLKRDKMLQRNEIKMLLLGAGESGKSTILKQMKLIHEGGYSRDERESFKEIIFSNTVQSMRVILEAMESLELPLDDQRAEYHVQTIFMQPQQIEGDNLPPEVGAAIGALWKDAGVQDCFKRSREYQLNDSAKYYFDNIDRISLPDYMPNDQDVLRSRVKTTGITETTFIIGDLTYRMFDVGGQRSERKKWIHCFENVTTILFLVAISEYDQLLFEDETVNRMQEALTLFDSICNSRWFIKTSIILFLNKIDRFKEKLPLSPMKNYFPDYEGGDDYNSACDYILNRFVSLNQHETKQIYTHFTCATDTTQIRFVMAAVNDIIIQENLRLCGLI